MFNPTWESLFENVAFEKGTEDGVMHMIDGSGPHIGDVPKQYSDMLSKAYWEGYIATIKDYDQICH